MQVQTRILSYRKARKISNRELRQISGGSSRSTVDTTQKGTGNPPGPVDVEFDQVWD